MWWPRSKGHCVSSRASGQPIGESIAGVTRLAAGTDTLRATRVCLAVLAIGCGVARTAPSSPLQQDDAIGVHSRDAGWSFIKRGPTPTVTASSASTASRSLIARLHGSCSGRAGRLPRRVLRQSRRRAFPCVCSPRRRGARRRNVGAHEARAAHGIDTLALETGRGGGVEVAARDVSTTAYVIGYPTFPHHPRG